MVRKVIAQSICEQKECPVLLVSWVCLCRMSWHTLDEEDMIATIDALRVLPSVGVGLFIFGIVSMFDAVRNWSRRADGASIFHRA
jgi:hypothetical protein